MSTQTYTAPNGTHTEADMIASTINLAFKAGASVEVNGRKVKGLAWTARPANVYGNGTVDVSVEPRSKGARLGTLYVKHGQTAHIVVTEA